MLPIILFHLLFYRFSFQYDSSKFKIFIKDLNLLNHFLIFKTFLNLNWIQIIHFCKFQEIMKFILKLCKKLGQKTKLFQCIFKVTIISKIIYILLFLVLYRNPEKEDGLNNNLTTFITKISKSIISTPIFFVKHNNGFVWGVGFSCERENIDQGRSFFNVTIVILNCFFTRSSEFSGNGGVILVDGGDYSMNINCSVFYSCVCSNQGGAIYFSSSYSYLSMICGNRCSCGASSSYNCHFAHLCSPHVNHVEYLSISNCSHTTSGYWSMHLLSGDQRDDNTNSSMNNAYRGSSFLIQNGNSFTSSYCTFSNNRVSDSICIRFTTTTGAITMSYASIVHNNSPSTYGVIYVAGTGTTRLMNCIFQNNQNYLFCVYSGNLAVSHSFIYHPTSFSTRTSVSTSTNNTFTNAMTYQIQYFNSLHCNADIPLIEPKQKYTIDQTHMKSFFFVYQVTIQVIN